MFMHTYQHRINTTIMPSCIRAYTAASIESAILGLCCKVFNNTRPRPAYKLYINNRCICTSISEIIDDGTIVMQITSSNVKWVLRTAGNPYRPIAVTPDQWEVLEDLSSVVQAWERYSRTELISQDGNHLTRNTKVEG